MKSLTSQQQRTLIFLIGTVLCVALTGMMVYNLRATRAQVAKLQQETEAKERDAKAAPLPSVEEQNKWADSENQVKNVLLPEQSIPEFMAEVTKIANENGLERIGLTTEETVIDPNKTPSAEETKLLAVGIHRYLVVTVKFQGQYPDVARFLGGVSSLRRPVEYRTIDMRRSPPLVDVTIVMNVYKKEAA